MQRNISSRKNMFGALLILWLALLSGAASAHPHVWADYWVQVNGTPQGITSIRLTWRFDTMFSKMVRDDLGISEFTPAAIEKIRTQAFSNLKNFHYYTKLLADGQTILPETVQDFSARLHGDQMEYSFTIPLPKPAQALEVALYDEELYVDIGPPMSVPEQSGSFMARAEPKPQNFVSTGGPSRPDCAPSVAETKQNPVWGDYKIYNVRCTAGAAASAP